jgi:hypothetical protein
MTCFGRIICLFSSTFYQLSIEFEHYYGEAKLEPSLRSFG